MDLIVEKSSGQHLDEGQILFSQGEQVENFYLLVQGSLKLFLLSPEGQEKVIEVISPGNTFGEALIFLEHPVYPVGVAALRSSEVIAIQGRYFKDMLRGSMDTCFLMLGSMSQRLRGLIGEIDGLSLYSGAHRVATYLLDSAPIHEDSFKLDIPKSIIASRLSIKPETLSRILKDLIEKKIIRINGSRVTICDRATLRALGASQV